MNGPQLVALGDVLATLYPTVEAAKLVVDGAGLRAPELIAFNHAAALNWHAILTHAEKQGQVPAVVAVALTKFGANAEFRRAVQALGLPLPPPVDPPRRVPTVASQRKLLKLVLPEVRDINAFCEDEYPETAEALDGALPDRISTLLRREGKTPEGRARILEKLRRKHPGRVAENEHVLVWE